MYKAEFDVSLKKAVDFLKEFGLYKSKGKKKVGDYSNELKKIAKKNKHSDYYKCAIRNFDYEILLEDDSIIQFFYGDDDIRYAFIQNPMTFMTKDDYLEMFFHKEELLEMTDVEVKDLYDNIDDYEYEQFLNEQELNTSANYIRYDASLKGYLPLFHSYSHIHIGNTNDFRIPMSKIMTPLMFVKFAIKNSYYKKWKSYFLGKEEYHKVLKVHKVFCRDLPSDRWKDIEENEFYLT